MFDNGSISYQMRTDIEDKMNNLRNNNEEVYSLDAKDTH